MFRVIAAGARANLGLADLYILAVPSKALLAEILYTNAVSERILNQFTLTCTRRWQINEFTFHIAS